MRVNRDRARLRERQVAIGEHYLEMPADYSQDDFMEFLFEEKIVLGQGEKGWKVNPAIVVSVRLDVVMQTQKVADEIGL